MNQASLATKQPDPGPQEVGYAFEPHVSDAFALGVLEFGRHCRSLGAVGERPGKDVVDHWAVSRMPAGGGQGIAGVMFEATVRLMEAFSTGTAHLLTARSAEQLMESQSELLSAYVDFLSAPLRWSGRQ